MSLPMLAVEIDGINYELVAKIKEATVIAKSSGEYSGEVVIPESVVHEGTTYSVKSIGYSAFYGCFGLRSVTISNSVTSIGDYAFSYSGLTSVTIPNSVTSIGKYAFYYCQSLTSVTIPNSVTSIGNNAFMDCSGLTSVHISDIAAWCNIEFSRTDSNPLYYAHYLYLNGEEVKDLVIPNSVTSIGKYAFRNCSGLTSVTIPNSVSSIGDYAFGSCSGLTSVTIGNSVESIGDYAFENCSGLTFVTIPNSVTSIGEGVFFSCSALTSLTIPNSVTSIGDATFYYCQSLTSVTIGNGLKSIAPSTFDGCDKLETVIIGNSVTSIGERAFYGCSGLTSVTIPNSVEGIERRAFYACSGLTSVTIGSGVKTIESESFANCPDLLDVYCYVEMVPSTKSDAFSGSYPEYATLHVPDGCIESYKTTEPWSGFGKIVGLSGEEPEVPEVEKCATPVVSYADGKLSMACETEGAEFITKITSNDFCTFNTSEIELSATYNIEVYATKSGYDNSDTISVALVWVENGDVSEETGVISAEATPVLIQGNGGVLNISGVAKNTEIVIYTVSGTEVARATATEGTTTINTGLQSGTIVIVKFGNKSVKIKI